MEYDNGVTEKEELYTTAHHPHPPARQAPHPPPHHTTNVLIVAILYILSDYNAIIVSCRST
jgi:hypothetical protein